MAQDKLYSRKLDTITPFEFNETVVNVFDDMIHRSVPLYKETVMRQAQLAEKFYKSDSIIYDLGCSNGNFGIRFLDIMGRKPFYMIAVDNSSHMIDTYRNRLSNRPNGDMIRTRCCNIQDVDLKNASVVVINLTLQFLPVTDRNELIRSVYNALSPDGILLMTEKIIHEDADMSDLQQEFYYRFKKENGYSNLEISQKRDALENVLVPETVESHLKRFTASGFTKTDIWQKWFNFTSFICRK